MTVGAVLSCIFVVLQLFHQIDWQWWQICLPIFIEIGFYPLIIGGAFVFLVLIAQEPKQ